MNKIKANLKMIIMVFKYSPLFAISALLMIIVDVLSTLIDLYILENTVDLIANGSTFKEVFLFIIVAISIKILLTIFNSIYNGYIRTRGRNLWVKKIQGIIYKKAMQIDIKYFDDPKLYDKFSRALKQSDLKTINCFESIVSLSSALCSVITLIVYIASKVPVLFALTFITSILSFVTYYIINKLRFKVYKETEVHEREMNYISRTFYLEKNSYDIKTTNIANLLLQKREKVYQDYDKKYRVVERKTFILRVLEDGIYQIVTNFVTYTYLMYQMYNGVISTGEFTSLAASIYKFINRFYNFSRSISNLGDKFLYVQDFLWLMEYEPNIETNTKKHSDFDFETLEFENINFKYINKEEYALKNVSFKINKGEKIAIIGYNGAGKTTLTKLLLKLYDPESGKIRINNIDYENLSAYDVRDKSSIILQNFQIYSASVLENVLMREKKYVDDEERVIEALRKVGLYDKIMGLPDGINTILTKEFSNDGIELSGGERQKLAIARVFASQSPIIILDEPTSALDPYAEKEINDDIIKMAGKKTIILISHRLSTIVNVDKIYVMESGEIKEEGTHNELMSQKGIYYKMFNAQAELYKE